MKLHAPNKPNHRALWMWLAEHPEGDKYAWPGFRTMERLALKLPHLCCFLCEETVGACTFANGETCPLFSCMFEPGLYEKYDKATTAQDRSEYAMQIANCWK